MNVLSSARQGLTRDRIPIHYGRGRNGSRSRQGGQGGLVLPQVCLRLEKLFESALGTGRNIDLYGGVDGKSTTRCDSASPKTAVVEASGLRHVAPRRAPPHSVATKRVNPIWYVERLLRRRVRAIASVAKQPVRPLSQIQLQVHMTACIALDT